VWVIVEPPVAKQYQKSFMFFEHRKQSRAALYPF
jgi:hypothetical protein